MDDVHNKTDDVHNKTDDVSSCVFCVLYVTTEVRYV